MSGPHLARRTPVDLATRLLGPVGPDGGPCRPCSPRPPRGCRATRTSAPTASSSSMVHPPVVDRRPRRTPPTPSGSGRPARTSPACTTRWTRREREPRPAGACRRSGSRTSARGWPGRPAGYTLGETGAEADECPCVLGVRGERHRPVRARDDARPPLCRPRRGPSTWLDPGVTIARGAPGRRLDARHRPDVRHRPGRPARGCRLGLQRMGRTVVGDMGEGRSHLRTGLRGGRRAHRRLANDQRGRRNPRQRRGHRPGHPNGSARPGPQRELDGSRRGGRAEAHARGGSRHLGRARTHARDYDRVRHAGATSTSWPAS